MTKTDDSALPELGQIFRACSGKVLAALISRSGNIQLAEDALQTACLKAGERWPIAGLPENPEAWLYTVAWRALLDTVRRDQHQSQAQVLAAVHEALDPESDVAEENEPIPDERLKLIFTCCHPALNSDAQVALTLRTLCGLTAREIARAFVLSETTLQQRLVRAKHKIQAAGIAYQVPEPEQLDERLDAVLEVLYLIFNESHTAFEGQTLSREDLANEAIRLARVLHALMPMPQTAGLLALMLLHQARYPARTDGTQGYVSLAEQDRSKWDQALISEGRSLVITALADGAPEKYQLQAAISALHSEADSWASTDWQQILLLYSTLYRLEANPVVKLNALVALGQTGQISTALDQLRGLATELEAYQPYHAAMADLSAQAGEIEVARHHFDRAIELSSNEVQREFLKMRRQSYLEPTVPK